MKVRNAPASVQKIDAQNLAGRKMDFPSGRQSFEQDFNDSNRERYTENIIDLAKKIDEQGMRLEKKIDIGEMERYRALISELLDIVVRNAYAFRKENNFDLKGRRKVSATIIKINEKLEEMAREILSGNQDAFRIISSIDDIKGLIIDIFL